MNLSPLRWSVWFSLALGLAATGFAAKVPNEADDLMRFLDPLWGKPAAAFSKAAKLKADNHQVVNSPAGGERRTMLLSEAARARWTPKSLAAFMRSVDFDPTLGLIEASGTLKGTTADFEALVKEMNARYGQYSTHTAALDVHTYGWVFPKATLSISSEQGVPVGFKIQANP